jgi:hypothetical protein
MVSKKRAAKTKGKDSQLVTTAGDGWRTSKCSEADLKRLVDECFLQPKEVIQWRPTTGDKRPYERAEEIVLFQDFVEHGLALSTSDFFRGLLFHYGIQLYHLNPNLILHIVIFVHFCEAFLGIEPHFDLFCYLFHLKPQPNKDKMYEVSGPESSCSRMEKKSIGVEGAMVLYWKP